MTVGSPECHWGAKNACRDPRMTVGVLIDCRKVSVPVQDFK